MTLQVFESGVEHAESIIFLHGLGVSSWMWQEQVEVLQDHFHCVTIDLPGNGGSHNEPWHSLRDSADSVAAIIRERAHSGKAHVVGLSLGGYVAIQLLLQHSDLLATVLVSGISTSPIVRPRLVKPLSNLSARLLQSSFLVNISGKMMQLPAEALELYKRDVALLSAETVKRIYDEVLRFTIPDIKQGAHKLLAVAGEKENKTVLAGLRLLHEQFPTITTATAPQAHHTWNAEFPDLFTAMIKSWVLQAPLPKELQIVHQPEPAFA